ncbi:superoxide dismutase family protein [Flavobacterium sp.]
MKKILLVLLVASGIIVACKSSSNVNANSLTITMEPKSGSNVNGTATFTEKNGEVTLLAKLTGLTPGIHAIHIHEKSDCSAADGTSTGGHWNPTFKKHGKFGINEYHRGDIGNFTADVYGNATVFFKTKEWAIGGTDETKNIIGKGLIVHKDSDDFVTQPTGNAGSRVACSGIIK